MTAPKTTVRHAARSRGPALVAVALAGVVSLAAAGCTSSGASGASGSSSSAGGGTTADAGGGSTPSSTTIVNQPEARKAVTAKSCKQTSSGWTATGTVTNPNAKQTTYTIVISFTTKASTVLARGTTKVTLKSGATKDWTASANFAKTKGVQCVLRGVAAS
jgi:hypothetical protein